MLSRFIIILLVIVFSTLISERVYAGNDMNKKVESNNIITPVKSGYKYKNWISTQKVADGNYLSATHSVRANGDTSNVSPFAKSPLIWTLLRLMRSPFLPEI